MGWQGLNRLNFKNRAPAIERRAPCDTPTEIQQGGIRLQRSWGGEQLLAPKITERLGSRCSSEYAPGWCQALLDGEKGACNEGEWATASVKVARSQGNQHGPTERPRCVLTWQSPGASINTSPPQRFHEGAEFIQSGEHTWDTSNRI